ncbi:hypothetical protein BG006_005631 [Podila minutissima]|uniref:NodB homology domain-containing protein n=1 Tax=Podila minutissima TaxID=64525 RepID=A0A9P5SJR3_9FUNG|nr:hypothetical protein BG006_005631 [Podila minutissima]
MTVTRLPELFGLLSLVLAVSAIICDTTYCKPPACICPSLNPPGGILPTDAPQFVTLTFDDAIQPASYQVALELLSPRNHNGCQAKGTWFATVQYCNPALAQRWYSAGNEVAGHTFNHIGIPSEAEIVSGKLALVKYGGIPRGKLSGFRTPFLNYTKDTLSILQKDSFQYDSSATALKDDAYWPYTLDNGLANDCWKGICNEPVKLPGLWEIPMHSILDDVGTPHLMDPYLDGNATVVEAWIRNNFDRHYSGGRAPFGLYIHPVHLVNNNASMAMLKSAIAYMASHPDVYFVTNQQLLKYMANPVSKAVLDSQDYMQCLVPSIPTEICNGRDDTGVLGAKIDQGLLETCSFATAAWATCYGCPATEPTAENPTPAPRSVEGSPGFRYAAPDDCDPLYWSPTENKCYCTAETCKYIELSPALKMPVVVSHGSHGSDAAALVRPFMDVKTTLTILGLVSTVFAFVC